MLNFRMILWLVGYEAFTLLLVWLSLRTPWKDPLDGSTRPTPNEVALMTHVYSYAFLVVAIVFFVIFMKIWRGSNRRR